MTTTAPSTPSQFDGKLALSVEEFCRACSVGRTFAFGEIAAHRLKTIKRGRRTLITIEAAREWLRG